MYLTNCEKSFSGKNPAKYHLILSKTESGSTGVYFDSVFALSGVAVTLHRSCGVVMVLEGAPAVEFLKLWEAQQ